jgi:hypothetical protein
MDARAEQFVLRRQRHGLVELPHRSRAMVYLSVGMLQDALTEMRADR